MATTTLFAWRPDLSVGVARMDHQHQELIRLTAELHSAMSLGQARSVLGRVLDDLVAYTEKHFAEEEQLMRVHAYPGLGGHRSEHVRLTRRVKELQQGFRGGSISITIEVLTFLKEWLVRHIQGMDSEYGRHIASRRS